MAATHAAPVADERPIEPTKKPRRIGWIIVVTLLSLGLIGAGVVIYLFYVRLEEAHQIIQEQIDLIDEKETFTSAMQEAVDTVAEFEGVPYAQLVPEEHLERLAREGWLVRWDIQALPAVTERVHTYTGELRTMLTTAAEQAATNATGTTYEAVIDSLGGGHVTLVLDDADSVCNADVWGCVSGDNPYIVHIDASEEARPYMNDLLRSGVTYHEFAHVLQFTNPAETREALKAFGDDVETMADCFALTYLPGWTLDHTIWVSDFEYWEVTVGYGYTCDEGQRQVIRDWYTSLGYSPKPISQG